MVQCDICKSKVKDYAMPIDGKIAIRKLEILYRNENIYHQHLCQNCSDRIISYIKLIKRESRREVNVKQSSTNRQDD